MNTPRNAAVATADQDPRLEEFARWLEALDRRDWKAGQVATRKLRALGISAVLLAPSPGGSDGRR